MKERESTSAELPSVEDVTSSRTDRVRIRMPSGEYQWVTPAAFSLISEREFQDSQRLRQLSRQRNGALALAAVAAVFLLAGLLYYLALPDRPARDVGSAVAAGGGSADTAARADAPVVDRSKAPADAAGPAVRQPEPAPVPGAAAAAGVTSAVEPGIETMVKDWAAAWTAQDVEQYLGFYSAWFRVPDGLDRTSWERLRRERLSRPKLLSVTVREIETTRNEDGSATARFVQTFRSPTYEDEVVKTLQLVLETGSWRIAEEVSSAIESGASSPEARSVVAVR